MEITEIGLFAVKAESTYATDPVPTVAANLIPIVADSLQMSFDSTPVERKLLDSTHRRLIGFNALPNVTMKFSVELRGNRTDGSTSDISKGAIANAVEIDPLLLAAHLEATYTSETGLGNRDGYVTYVPARQTGVGPSVTCYFWSALKLHKLLGGKVNIDRILFEADKMAMIDFTVKGKYSAVTDITFSSIISGSAFMAPGLIPPTVYGGTPALVFSSLELSLNNEIALRPDIHSTDGVKGFVITDQMPKGKWTPESVSVADHSVFAYWRTGSLTALAATTQSNSLISETGNIVTINATAMCRQINYANQNKTRIHNIEFDCVRDSLASSTAEFSLVFA